MANNYQRFIFAALTGLILAGAYPGWNFDFGFLVWFGLMPLLWLPKINFRDGFIAGVFYFAISTRWLWSLHPLDSMGIESRFVSLVFVAAIYLASLTIMALFWGLFSLILTKLRLAAGRPLALLLAPALFTLLEYARAYGFGLLWFGSSTLLGPHWTIGNLAYSLSSNFVIRKLAAYGGIYGITFLVVIVNLFFSEVLKKKQIAIALVLLGSLSGLYLSQSFHRKVSQADGRPLNFALIQTSEPTKLEFTPQEELSYFNQQLGLLASASRSLSEKPESGIIVFPEASNLLKDISFFLDSKEAAGYFKNLSPQPQLIVSGLRAIESTGQSYSRVIALDSQEGLIDFYDKRLLTPVGEFLPYPVELLARLFSQDSASFRRARQLSVGEKTVSTVNFRGRFNFAPTVCSELLSPSLLRRQAKQADIIVAMTSTGAFRGNTALIRQNMAINRFRATELNKPLLMSANMGLSYAVNEGGEIEAGTVSLEPQVLTGSVILRPGESWYNRLGDWPILLVSGLVLLGSTKSRKNVTAS